MRLDQHEEMTEHCGECGHIKGLHVTNGGNWHPVGCMYQTREDERWVVCSCNAWQAFRSNVLQEGVPSSKAGSAT